MMLRPASILTLLGIVLIWGLAFAGLYHIIRVHIEKPDGTPLALVGYTAALVALAGWMFQSLVAIRNSRKQHTMNVLLQTRLNATAEQHIEEIDRASPNGAKITLLALKSSENKTAYDAVRWILNYYEFIARWCPTAWCN